MAALAVLASTIDVSVGMALLGVSSRYFLQLEKEVARTAIDRKLNNVLERFIVVRFRTKEMIAVIGILKGYVDTGVNGSWLRHGSPIVTRGVLVAALRADFRIKSFVFRNREQVRGFNIDPQVSEP